MGVSTDAILAYGWDLGTGYEDRYDDAPSEVVSHAHERSCKLIDEHVAAALQAQNITRPSSEGERDDAFWAAWDAFRAAEAQARLTAPVEIIQHCCDAEPMYILTCPALNMQARRGYPENVTAERLITSSAQVDAMREQAALMGIELVGDPAWLLAAWWG